MNKIGNRLVDFVKKKSIVNLTKNDRLVNFDKNYRLVNLGNKNNPSTDFVKKKKKLVHILGT